MVRKTTKTEQKWRRIAQWDAAWLLLTSDQRAAIFKFLTLIDNDIGRAIVGAD